MSANVASGPPKQLIKTGSRSVSPARSSRSTSTPMMPSPRSSPAVRPTSPLSPQYGTAVPFQTLQPPSPRAMHSRTTGNNQRRANTNSLKLPSLPRFHPANFPQSSHSSAQSTPESPGMGCPQPPTSPRGQQRVINEAQRQLYVYQREAVSAARSQSPARLDDPQSPRLAPLGSPGPVTPLELEGDGGYLVAGVGGAEKEGVRAEDLVEELIKEEATRKASTSTGLSRTTSR